MRFPTFAILQQLKLITKRKQSVNKISIKIKQQVKSIIRSIRYQQPKTTDSISSIIQLIILKLIITNLITGSGKHPQSNPLNANESHIYKRKRQINGQQKKYIQIQINQISDKEVQKDLKWSQNIKSNCTQWRQLRDGKNQINIHPSSEEPTKQSQINSIEKEEIIEKSKLKLLYDWKMIYKSKAFWNDTLQNFINQNNPQLDKYDSLKVFNLAIDYLNINSFTQEYHEVLREIQETTNQQKVSGILNIFYNKELLDNSTKEYTEEEMSEQFANTTESPGKSHIYKMAEVIDRYIKKLTLQLLKIQMKQKETQDINPSQYDQKTNINEIIEVLRHIILNKNANPYQMFYYTSIGVVFITFFNHLSIDWQQVYEKEKII